MYCAAYAAAAVLGKGWTRDRVWLHVRALREQRGGRVPAHPRGGICMGDITNLLNREGCAVEVLRLPRRTTLGDFRRGPGRTGRWILGQPRHVFPLLPSTPRQYNEDRVFLNCAWRVTRRPIPGGTATAETEEGNPR